MLESLGRGPNRAAHLHFMVKAEGFDTVVTHIFPDDCPYLPNDAVFGVKQSLITTFRRVEDAETARRWGIDAPFWLVARDFTLCRTATSASSPQLDRRKRRATASERRSNFQIGRAACRESGGKYV